MGLKLQIASDIHFEWMNDYGAEFVKNWEPEPDSVLVLAGDVFNGAPSFHKKVEERVSELCDKWSDVIYVPGNHFFYGTGPEAQLFLKELEARHSAFVYLDRWGTRKVRGQRFLGDTMWFPKLSRCWEYEPRFSDFHKIDRLADWCYDHNAQFRKLLEQELLSTDVVVTHHLPATALISTRFIGNVYNMFFLSNMEDIILTKKPKLWIFGHTHEQFDIQLHDTRLVSNPRGYDWEQSQANWNPSKMIEL